MSKRIVLFLLTNLGVMVMLAIVIGILRAFGISIDMNTTGGLLVFSLVWGLAGSFISLWFSKAINLKAVGGRIIENPANQDEAWLLSTVERLAMQWNLKTPQVAIYDSPDPNAFATGARKNASLIAVSTGLMQCMTKDEVEGVLGHEMAHIGNGDMVTMTLIQGVVNSFVIFFSQVISQIAAAQVKGRGMQMLVFNICNVFLHAVFTLLASVVVMWFSRMREYRADAGSAKFVGTGKMVAALRKLQYMHGQVENEPLPQSVNAMGISGSRDSLFSTHPSLENRIARLQQSPM
ncbi:MAG: protease HtpX [Neisseriaceae bacterium]|nr:protease HtpX [Neisseriaceae bacterium]